MNGMPPPRDRRRLIRPLSQPLNDVGADHVSALADMRVYLVAPEGYVTAERDCRYARIGFMVYLDDGRLIAVPCVDATALQVAEVARQADDVKINGGLAGPRWTRIRNGWECSILEPVARTPLPIPRCGGVVRR